MLIIKNFTKKILKYLKIAQLNSLEIFAYRINIWGRILLITIRIWILTQLYQLSYHALDSATINGFTYAMTIWILIITLSFQFMGRIHTALLIEEEVKNGTIAYSMSRPYSYVFFHFSSFIGRCTPHVVLNFLVAIPTLLTLVGPLKTSGEAVFAGMSLVVGGYLLKFLIDFCMGIAAFWIDEIRPIIWIYEKCLLILGGTLIPIALLPDTFRTIAEHLPFSQLLYSGAQSVVRFNGPVFKNFLFIQWSWILFFSCIAYFLFRKAVYRVSINGG